MTSITLTKMAQVTASLGLLVSMVSIGILSLIFSNSKSIFAIIFPLVLLVMIVILMAIKRYYQTWALVVLSLYFGLVLLGFITSLVTEGKIAIDSLIINLVTVYFPVGYLLSRRFRSV